MKVYKYFGNSKLDPWYLNIQVKWWLRIKQFFIHPVLTCNDCEVDVKKQKRWWGVVNDNVYCQDCYKSKKI